MSASWSEGALYLVGADPRTYELWRELREIAGTRQPVLIVGPTGTGKDVVAREIHAQSSRKDKVYVPVNCAELTPELAGSELFGHEKGSFTGADGKREGLFRKANGGTLFLDEIGELPLQVQAKLLRVMEDGKLRAQGSDSIHEVNVRLIGATNRDIHRTTGDGAFRADLKARFARILELQPLCERPNDVEPLALHFIRKHAGDEGMNSSARAISEKALVLLREHSWPENVRELERVIKNALINSRSSGAEVLDVEHLRLSAPRFQGVLPSSHAEAAVVELANSIITALLSGDLERQKIPDLANRYRGVSLEYQIARAFLRRFSGEKATEMARELFGYSSAEAVRRFGRDGE